MTIAIILVVIILSLLIFVHELGHFWAARRAGVEVEEFGFGLPPRIWGIKRGDTLYSINLLPVGGFVRLKGEDDEAKGPGSFAAAKYADKVKILLAGVTMNAIVGFLILLYLALTGVPPLPGINLHEDRAQVAQPRQVMAAAIAPDSPAAKAGIEKGDIILTADGTELSEEEQLREFTKGHAGEEVTLTVQRGNDTRQLEVELGESENGQLGVLPLQVFTLRYGLLDAILVSFSLFAQIAAATILAFAQLIASIPELIGALISQAPAEPAAVGPVGITAILSNIFFLGYRYLLVIVVSITISLAVVNAMPLPALDGGRMLVITVQRLFGRELPKKIESGMHLIGFVLLLGLIVLITYFDIKRFF